MTAKGKAILVGIAIAAAATAFDAFILRDGFTLVGVLSSLAAGAFAAWLLYMGIYKTQSG